MNDELVIKLRAPFPAKDIQWKPQQTGVKSNGEPWAMVLAYVDARALQERLDDVFGVLGWQTEYRVEADGIICRLSVISSDGKWNSKEDGAEKTDIEAFKGGISSAFKRVCSSGFGIGRYLYALDTVFAEISIERPKDKTGWHQARDKKSEKTFFWKEPSLPAWALPPIKQPPKSAK